MGRTAGRGRQSPTAARGSTTRSSRSIRSRTAVRRLEHTASSRLRPAAVRRHQQFQQQYPGQGYAPVSARPAARARAVRRPAPAAYDRGSRAAVQRRLGHRRPGPGPVRRQTRRTRTASQARRGYGAEQPDYYGDARRVPAAGAAGQAPPGPRAEPETGWDPGPDQGEHAFFAGGDDDEDDDDDAGRRRGAATGGGRKGGRGGKKQEAPQRLRLPGRLAGVRSAASAGVGYFGYQFYQDRFGTAPDYAGERHRTVERDDPEGRRRLRDGPALKEAGVVKSVDAFVAAQARPQGQSIQAGRLQPAARDVRGERRQTDARPQASNNLDHPRGHAERQVYAADRQEARARRRAPPRSVAKNECKSLGLPAGRTTTRTSRTRWRASSSPSATASASTKPADVLQADGRPGQRRSTTSRPRGEGRGSSAGRPAAGDHRRQPRPGRGQDGRRLRQVAAVVYNRLKPTNTETNGCCSSTRRSTT